MSYTVPASQTPSESFLNPDAIVSEFGIVPGMRIADFGSGAGHIAILIAQRAGENGTVTAIDIMEEKLDSVRVKAKAAGITTIETVRANLEVLGSSGLAEQSQDIAILVNILFQSIKKADILKEAKRVIRPGGTIVVVDWKKRTGGFGPPDELRTDEVAMQTLISSEGFTFGRTFNAGQFHYGLIFTKS